jgi:hypothetical protein
VGDIVEVAPNYSAHNHWRYTGRIIKAEEREMHTEYEASIKMSHDRVKFFIGKQYFGPKLGEVLSQAFGYPESNKGSWTNRMRDYSEGFYLVCRPSQFARFMILRDAAGLVNGFKDLHAELFVPQPPKDIYTRIADATEVDRDSVKRVMLAFAYNADELEDRFRPKRVQPECPITGRSLRVFDVSSNPHTR